MEWSAYKTQLEALPKGQRKRVVEIAERLVEKRGLQADEAVLEALRRSGAGERADAPKHPAAIQSPDVSLAQPHGPEGESHGGREGRDPLQFVEDSTPNGTNAYSAIRGAPAEKPSSGPQHEKKKRPALNETDGRATE